MEFVVLDVETTGLKPGKGAYIIEIGAVKVKNGKIVDEFSQFVNPGVKIPKKVTELTNITDEMVSTAPSINIVLQEFWNFIDGQVVLAHNARFDWDTFLKVNFAQVSKYVMGEAVCTLSLSRKVYGTTAIDEEGNKFKVGNKLEDICKRNDVELKNAHRAAADCKALAECILKMSNEYPIVRDAILNGDRVELDKSKDLKIEYKISSVKYWEAIKPRIKNEIPPRRFYVDLISSTDTLTDLCYPGTVIFDINTKSWFNKDFLYNLDYKQLEQNVLKVSGVSSLEELYYQKRRAWRQT